MRKSIVCSFLLGFISFHSSAKVYTLDEVTNIAKTQNYEVRKKFEGVYQARKTINSKIGKIAPHINLSVIPGFSLKNTGIGILSPFSFVGAFIGFIFPANWFALGESRLILEGQKRFYISAIANQINAIENLYYKLHETKEFIKIYEDQKAYHQSIIDTLKQREILGVGDPEARLSAEIILAKMLNDIELLKDLSRNELREMAVVIGLKDSEINQFEIEDIKLDDLRLQNKKSDDILKKAIDRSVELVGFEYLKLAAKYAKRKRAFEFFLPSGDEDGSLGFGYPANIQIGKSQEHEIDIEMDEMRARLFSSASTTIESFSVLSKILLSKNQILEIAQKRAEIIKAKFEISGSLDMLRYAESMNELISTKIEIATSRHELAAIQSGLNRLLWEGPHYKEILPTIFLLKKGELTKEQKRENRHLNKAINKGELVLPVENYVN